ncbi:glutathione S-transferase C-terminal-like protein [Melanogaster broomeanus]|nr:glutathione S-transferase C-terminal-like protein [Melanogaster broomeanus]
MVPIGTLWGIAFSILAAAAVAGLELDTPAVEFRVTNQTPEYLSKFPFGKLPAFEDTQGFKLFEGAAIARYVSSFSPESGLLGNSANEAALVDQWVHFGESEIATFSYETMALVAGYLGPYSKEVFAGVSQQAGRITCGSAERAQYPQFTAHPKVKAVFGEAEFVEDAMAYKATY